MNRCVEREWLDELPAGDPSALGSRRDLKQLNTWMGNARIVQRALGSFPHAGRPARIAEIGAGDGSFLLRVAQRLGCAWRGAEATLVDWHSLLTEKTIKRFGELGWRVELRNRDVFDWCQSASAEQFDLVLANLFLHHFSAQELVKLLRAIELCSGFFVAVEPRRSLFSLGFSKLVGLIGCNAVTRHDAPISVRAGFSGRELSRLWRDNGEWSIQERATGPFSHLFVAHKKKRSSLEERRPS